MTLLSAPAVRFFDRIGLLEDPAVVGLTSFAAPFSKKPKIKIWKGGLFLSRKSLDSWGKKDLIFYDDSRELGKLLGKKVFTALPLKLRGKDPFESTRYLMELFSPFLLNCQTQLKKLEAEVIRVEKLLTLDRKKTSAAVFYLGELKSKKRPEMLVINDLFVKPLVDTKKLTSYPSSLSYISWSRKILDKFLQEFRPIEIGLVVDPKVVTSPVVQKVTRKKMNFRFAFMLMPGVDQLTILSWFLSNFQGFVPD